MDLAILSDELSLDLGEALVEGAGLGFRKYEIRCIDSYDRRVPDIADAAVNTLLEAIESERIEVTALSPGVFKIDPADLDKVRTQMEVTLPRTCQLAVRVGAPRVIVFGFMNHLGGSLDAACSLLREAGKVVGAFDLEMAVENEPGSFCDTGVATAAVVESLGQANVGINWDPANAIVSGEVAYPIGYEAVRPHLQNLHVKDAIPVPPNKWENRLIGDGGMNWLGQLRALARDKALSHVTLETHLTPLLESTREDLRRLSILFKAIEQFDETELA